jgi:hypothetical protein
VLKAQGLQPNQRVEFLTDGGDTVRELPRDLSPESEHWLDWFHITTRLTVLGQMTRSPRYVLVSKRSFAWTRSAS